MSTKRKNIENVPKSKLLQDKINNKQLVFFE